MQVNGGSYSALRHQRGSSDLWGWAGKGLCIRMELYAHFPFNVHAIITIQVLVSSLSSFEY